MRAIAELVSALAGVTVISAYVTHQFNKYRRAKLLAKKMAEREMKKGHI